LKRYVVVGAGAAGLTLAYLLTKAGLPVTVVEKESEVGGLARSFHYDEWHFDIGPHRFYSANPVVGNFLSEVMGDDFLEISRSSAVHFMGHYHSWPLRLETLPKLPLGIALRAGLDLLGKAARASEHGVSFEDYVLRRYGRTLYQTFFRDYTEKFLGIPTSDTHQNWAKVGVERATIDEKVNTASLAEIFKLMLIPKPSELKFLYPERDGVHAFWKRCAEKILSAGGEILAGKIPQRLETGPEGLSRVVLDDRTLDCEVLAWSGPIPELARMLHRPAPNLAYRSHVVYNVLLDSPPGYMTTNGATSEPRTWSSRASPTRPASRRTPSLPGEVACAWRSLARKETSCGRILPGSATRWSKTCSGCRPSVTRPRSCR